MFKMRIIWIEIVSHPPKPVPYELTTNEMTMSCFFFLIPFQDDIGKFRKSQYFLQTSKFSLFKLQEKTVALKMALTDHEGTLILDFQPPNL